MKSGTTGADGVIPSKSMDPTGVDGACVPIGGWWYSSYLLRAREGFSADP
jgi:hypothetical protein